MFLLASTLPSGSLLRSGFPHYFPHTSCRASGGLAVVYDRLFHFVHISMCQCHDVYRTSSISIITFT